MGDPRASRKGKGFTLIELMVTISVMTVLMTVAVPAMRDFLIRNNTAAIANEFSGSLMRTRAMATTRNTCMVMCRSTTTMSNPPSCVTEAADWQTGWMIFQNSACDAAQVTPGAMTDVIGVVNATNPNFSLIATNRTAKDYILIYPTGYPRATDAGGYDLRYQSETLASNQRICVNAMGQVFVTAYGGTCP